MKKTVKALSFILAAVTLMSSTATLASAGNIWKNEDSLKKESSAIEETVEEKTTGNHVFLGSTSGLKTASSKSGSNIFVQKKEDNTSKYPFEIKTTFGKPCGLYGAKYYSKADAKDALEKYFKENSYDLYMTEGQEKTFCKDAYFYSTDTDVVYYDYRSDTLVAEENGTADVYVYTTGGIPFFKLHVTVDRKTAGKKDYPTLDVVPDSWRLDVGETTEFTVTASDGKEYDDLEFSVKFGAKRVSLTQVSHKLTAEKDGAVVVYVYSKSHPEICGETLIYVGPYEYTIRDGYWSYDKDCISVKDWYRDWYCDGDLRSYITGWVRSAEGIFIPVIKFTNAVVDDNGEKRETTIATVGTMSYIDLIRGAYGDKALIASIIKKYNLEKYGFDDDDVWNRYYYMDQIFKYIG